GDSRERSFGATAPPFLDYLKGILCRYPDGGQILKELIQNADDARATEVIFIHDERSYGTEGLWNDNLGQHQGPALYAYNNAVFTDEDWERIQKAGRSGKINDPNKIGRFGIGFNSVYHITDVPSIFSSGHLGLMDPQEEIFGDKGFLWFLNDPEDQESLMTMQDQFQPYRDIVSLVGKQEWSKIIENQYFPGTIFRLPLRNKVSEISDNLYNSDKMVDLFDSFITQFIPLSEAVIPCPTSLDKLFAIKRALVSCGENLVSLPANVLRAIEVYPHTNPKHVTPSFLRKVLHRSGVHNINKEDKLCILEYILSDGEYKELEGLQLLPLSDGSFKSFTNKEEDTLAQLVTKAGGTVVRGNDWLKHVDLETYVLSPSPMSVMKVLMNLDFQQVISTVTCATKTAREELKDCLSHLDSLSGPEKDFLIRLPLFQTMTGSLVTAQSKQALVLTAGPGLAPQLPVPDSVIQCSTEADQRLLQLLKVNLLGPAEVGIILVDRIKQGACNSQVTENIMTWILQHGNILFSRNQSLKNRCKELRFIQGKGGLKRASDFFDPRVKNFRVILESDFFPPSVYTEAPQILESLIDLGLINKEADLTPEHLLYATTIIEKQKVNSEGEALQRAQVLLEILDACDLLTKFSNAQLNTLKKTKWFPCDQPLIERGDIFNKSTNIFYSPEEIRHTMYEDIVGEVMPVIGKLSERVNNKLGLKSLPPPEKVIKNLSVLKLKVQDMDDPDTNVDFKRKLHSIYRHMQENISAFLMNTETDWLWAHDKFVSPCELVLNYPQDLDLSSYIGKVPNEFLPYKELLKKFGLRISISNKDIVGMLHSIQQNIEARQQPFASPAEVKVSIEILNWLWKTKQTVQGDIPVPVITEDEQFTLKPQSEALLCDVSRHKLEELELGQEKMYLLHKEIPIAAAEWLKIRFLSNYILAPEPIGIEQCGQSEPITTRIKNILKEYDEDGDIFKELIQNAEDAGADACKFLVDFREHKDPPESLIDPDMALCQGPCLWAFNNKQFTGEDWTNIVRVGSASKESKAEKIGKFGLGFNTVYHVTDIPSILSGSKLLILDPNVTHLRKHISSSTNPGIKLDLSVKRLFHCFPSLFGPYEGIFECNFTQKCPPDPYDGTLIKLPFRNENEAQTSDISRKAYHKEDITGLYQNFMKNSQTLLLFLKNINTLSLESICSKATTLKAGEVETILSMSKTVLSVPVEDKTIISKQRQAETSLLKHDSQCKNVIDSNTVSIVHIYSQHSNKTEQHSWLIYTCLGTGQTLKMFLQPKEKAVFSLPIGGIAVPLQQDTETGKFFPPKTDLIGQAFCFLPLPIQTGLPVNINGTFAVMSNRKGLWESGVKHEWNKALLEDPLVTAYVTALLALKKMSENGELEAYCYHTFWPEREKVSDTFKPLVDELYSNIAQSSTGPKLFFDGEKWCSMDNAIFLHESIEENGKINQLAAQVCKKHVKAPNCVVPLPLWLRKSFKQAGLKTILQNRTWTWEKFYQEVVFKNLDAMDPKTRDTLVLHAVDLNLKGIDSLLTSYPCIPTTDGNLQYIKKLVNPSSRVACLFEPEEGRLLGGSKQDFCSPKRIQRLLELGMAGDHLPLEDITEKACKMTEMWSVDKKKAYDNVTCLLELLKEHLEEKDSPQWEKLKITTFLPAFSPGDIKMKKDTLFYNDTPWMPVESSITLCNENIPRPMAIHFGIQTTRHHTLENNTVDNFSPFSFHFEQQEQLTVRIKNIISAYPSKKDILKELLQNADDAEATEIHFIWDRRQHGKEKTFGERWNDLQGPALCVFNNKVFSDDDLKGIQQLGEGGKQNLQGKIGKYGIGFNSVYLLTDCPSILTGDAFLCISDPNQKFIENHSDCPRNGIGYIVNDRLKMYIDVYESFLPDHFILTEGTMFRLPLRTSTIAENSKISKQEVTDKDISELFSALYEDPEGLILFLKNICKIKVHEINDTSGKLNTIFVVEKKLSQESVEEKDGFEKQLQIALHSDKPITPCNIFYEIEISISDKRQSVWIIAEQFGSFQNVKFKLPNKLPQVAIAALLNTNYPNSFLSSFNDFQGTAFCSLPLPGKTGLPVHVNGNFEVDSSRKHMWNEDGQSQKSYWNESLKKNMISPLYAVLLDFIKHKAKGSADLLLSTGSSYRISYFCFWPVVSTTVAPEWHEMIMEVYREIKKKCLDVIPVLRISKEEVQGQDGNVSSLDWSNLVEREPTKVPYLKDSASEKIFPILEGLGMKLVPQSMHKVWKTIQKAGIKVRFVCPAHVREFLCAKPLNDPTKTDEDLPLPLNCTLIGTEKRCSELLNYCLKNFWLEEIKENDSTLLDGLPLLLTKDKILRRFNSMKPKVIAKYDDLFLEYEDQFADYAINAPFYVILKNFNLVKMLTLPCAAKALKSIGEKLLHHHCKVDPDIGLYIPNEKMLKWLELLWKFIASEIKDESLTLVDVRKLFSECSFLPVVCPILNDKSLLQTMECMSNVIPNASPKNISHILFKLGFLRLDNIFFYKAISRASLDGELLDVNDKRSVLNHICSINQSKFSQLSNDDMKELQIFLQSGISKSKDQRDYQQKFKSLPIFETILGERTKIDGPMEVFLLSSKYSAEFPYLFTLSNSYSIFLKPNPENQSLSQVFHIKILTDLEFFMKFILPFVQTFTEEEILKCLKLILKLYNEENFFLHIKGIVRSLKSLKLIRSYQGELESASYYYDDTVELYRKMMPRERFFVFPEKIREDLCNYHQPFASENTTVQMRGSLIDGDPKHQDLIWSSMPIIHLPVYISQTLLQNLKKVELHTKPPSQYVTRNIGNICQSPCKSEQMIKTRAEVFRHAYAYLQTNGFDSQSLYGLPVVLVEKDTVLFKADCVCLSLQNNLEFRPYLYAIPSEDALYAEFFKKVGVEKEATAKHYCNVLAAVYADSSDKQQLNANQLITVKRAVHHLFLLIKTQGNQILSGVVQTLYLPAVDGKLQPSSSLYYNDTVFEIKRLKDGLEDKFLLLEKLSECHLGSDVYEHHRLVKMLPSKLQPKMLSKMTSEKVVESDLKLCELGHGCEFSEWFNKHLSSEPFKYGLICLFREQTEGKLTEEKATDMCRKIFGSITIVCCKSLKTVLWLDEQQLHKTARETDVFVKQNQHGFTLFLKHSDDNTPKAINEVNMTLIKEINVLLGNNISSVHLPVLGQLLMCDSLEDVKKSLAKNEIHDSAIAEIQMLNPSNPGTDIPDEWHDALDMSFLNNFEEGEYVGYNTNDTYIYAVVIEELPGHSGKCSWKYIIDIGDDKVTEVGHLDLFQFKRDNEIKTKGIRFKISKKLELVVGSVPQSSQQAQSSLPDSLNEAKREIDKCLAEIWTLPDKERKKAIKRLYLRWHPDKNICNLFAKEAFQYLQHQIDELTNSRENTVCSSYHSRTSNYRNFYQQWDQEAQCHRSGRERFFRSRGSHSYNFWTHNTNIPKPNREEAKRWYKQARCDLNAAQKDTSGGSTEWCLFKVHQAVEKALSAAEYKHHGKHTTNSSISVIAEKVSCYHPQLRDLPQIVEDLKSLGVDAKKTQYPNFHPYPHIPNERFRSETGILAVDKASELLNMVGAYVN
uniref:HEPN domain-containing protein n=1 Tax=Cyprinodon variegatus TaxID=28743 RepID=A0A3Q2FV80_CYPVA